MRGPLLLLAALGLFAVLDTNSKLLSGTYPPAEVIAIRHVTLLALLVVLRLGWTPAQTTLATRHPGLHLLRAGGMLGSSFGFFLALRSLPLAEAYLVYFTAPFMTLTLSVLFLGERVPAAAWGWCVVGFGGVLLALFPGLSAGGALSAYLWALLGTASYALVMTINRGLKHETGFARLVLWSSAPGLLAVLPFAANHWVAPGLVDFLALAGNGVLSGAATLCLAGAFRAAPASRLAPLEFSALAWGLLADFAVWGVLPGAWTLAGAAVVVLAGLMSQRVTVAPGAG
ncbi:DMT family transporter [Roseomonas sp. BN140053]|uniref:DMT family transporter n=1 Tax=Roseomonas sp. BN140053 TaxID=3391898 RepID=UPI0039E969AF